MQTWQLEERLAEAEAQKLALREQLDVLTRDPLHVQLVAERQRRQAAEMRIDQLEEQIQTLGNLLQGRPAHDVNELLRRDAAKDATIAQLQQQVEALLALAADREAEAAALRRQLDGRPALTAAGV